MWSLFPQICHQQNMRYLMRTRHVPVPSREWCAPGPLPTTTWPHHTCPLTYQSESNPVASLVPAQVPKHTETQIQHANYTHIGSRIRNHNPVSMRLRCDPHPLLSKCNVISSCKRIRLNEPLTAAEYRVPTGR